jgi:hypothetical protein
MSRLNPTNGLVDRRSGPPFKMERSTFSHRRMYPTNRVENGQMIVGDEAIAGMRPEFSLS